MWHKIIKNLALSLIYFTPSIAYLLNNVLPVASEDILLGMSAAFQGPSKALGIELYRGSMAYFEHINSQGGVNGKKIAIVPYDDSYTPVKTIHNTIQLVEKDRVFLLFNYVGTPTVTRILPLLKKYSDRNALSLNSSSQNNIYLLFPFTGAQPHRQYPYQNFVYNLRASYRQETEALVDNFLKIGRKRIAVFYQIDAYGRGGWDGVRRSLAKNNLKIVAEATYRRGTTYNANFQQQVKILREANTDAIVSVGSYAACAGFIREARNAGWDVPIANISFVGSESLLQLLKNTEKENNKKYTMNLINSQVVPSYEDTSLPAVREYRQMMERYQPMPPPQLLDGTYQPLPYSFVSFEGFLNAKLLVKVLQKAALNRPTINLPSLRIGDSGQVVTELQLRLEKEGFSPGAINGVFSKNTREAAIAFQKSRGLVADGIVSQKTWLALENSQLSRHQIPQAIENFKEFDLGIDTPISFGKKQHQGLNKVYYTTIENGRFVPLTDWQRWAK